jgi:hypothetical protein
MQIPNWMKDEISNLYKLMKTDLFLVADVPKTETDFHYYDKTTVGSKMHMSSNIPNLIYIFTYILGIHNNFEQDRNFLERKPEKSVITVNAKKYVNHMVKSSTEDKQKGSLLKPKSSSWTTDFLP